MKSLTYILPVALLILTASCEDQKENMNTTPPATFDAFVIGTVSDGSGNPVSNANVLVEFSFSECETPSFLSGGVAESDVDGKFRENIRHPIQESVKCLRLTAAGPRNSSLDTTTVMQDVEVTLKHFEPADTITIDVRFPN